MIKRFKYLLLLSIFLASPVFAQTAGFGGGDYRVLYYQTNSAGPANNVSCPTGWTDVYGTSTPGYGPHFLGLLVEDWYSLTPPPPGGGWLQPPPNPIEIPPPPTTCFTPDTPVALADGSTKPIKDIRAGEQVASFDQSGEIVSAKVQQVIRHDTPPTFVTIVAGGQKVVTTPEHRFYVGDGFAEVKNLQVGETLYLLTKENTLHPALIESLEYSPGTSEVYNLSIEKTQTYFAGRFAVHNVKPVSGDPPSGGAGGGPPPGDGPGGGEGSSPPPGSGSGDPPPPPEGEGPTTRVTPKQSNFLASLTGSILDAFPDFVQIAKAQSGAFNYYVRAIAIGSDSVCSQADKVVVPFADLYNNSMYGSQFKLYSRACFTDPLTGVIECNRCRVCTR